MGRERRGSTKAALKGGGFTASKFSLKVGETVLYTFEVSKWFVGDDSIIDYNRTQALCKAWGEYRVPSVGELTNANGEGWTGGLSGQGNQASRALGNGKQTTAVANDDGVGGFYSEWGNVGSYRNNETSIGDYVNWAVEGRWSDTKYAVSRGGVISNYAKAVNNGSTMCVTP